MRSLLKLIAQLFSDDRFELKLLAISVFVIAFATAIHIAAPGISVLVK